MSRMERWSLHWPFPMGWWPHGVTKLRKLKTTDVIVQSDTTATPIYWGSCTTLPTSGMLAEDTLFDGRAPSSGGGILRYWTSSAWAEMLSSHPRYNDTKARAMDDMVAWTRTYGSTLIAAVTAMLVNLTAHSGFIANLGAQVITLALGGLMKSANYEAGVAGFRFDYLGNFEVNNLNARGSLNGIDPEKIVPMFVNRVKYATPGSYNWTVPAGIKWVRVTCIGGGGGGGGGASAATNTPTSGGNGGASSFGSYLSANGGSGGIHGAGQGASGGAGGSGGTGNNGASSDYLGGYNGAGGAAGANASGPMSYVTGGAGGNFGSNVGMYNAEAEYGNAAGGLAVIAKPAGGEGGTSGHVGYSGANGGGGGGGVGYNTGSAGGGGGAGGLRQRLFKITAAAGATISVVVGAAGSAGSGGSASACNAGAGGAGLVMIEYSESA